MKGFFITGTDTEIGKTEVTAALMRLAVAQGYRVAGMKPVASGCVQTTEGLRNEDAVKLRACAGNRHPYEWVNPFAFEPAIAPHLAALEAEVGIGLQPILGSAERLAADADLIFVEGVGGWMVPLAADFGVPELVKSLNLPVILVVGLRLGCINHARLSEDSIRHSGCELAGWVGNYCSGDFERSNGNIETLQQVLTAPCLGFLPFAGSGDPSLATHDLDPNLFPGRS